MKTRETMKPKNPDSARFGQYVATLREQLNMTQGELCRRTEHMKMSLSRSYISRIEAGQVLMPSKSALESLARALNTTVADLLSHAGYKMPEASRSDDEFSLTLNRLRDMNLTREEREDILLAIEVALERVGRRKSKIASSKPEVNTERQLQGTAK